jgi:hypothetical protein
MQIIKLQAQEDTSSSGVTGAWRAVSLAWSLRLHHHTHTHARTRARAGARTRTRTRRGAHTHTHAHAHARARTHTHSHARSTRGKTWNTITLRVLTDMLTPGSPVYVEGLERVDVKWCVMGHSCV